MKMQKYLSLLPLLIALILISCSDDNPVDDDSKKEMYYVKLFDEVIFFDAYKNIPVAPEVNGLVMLKGHRYAKKIPENFINSLSNKLQLDVTIKAQCDNYDRIGMVFLGFVEKGSSHDQIKDENKIELVRFITPFMDRHKEPDEVPYTFEIDNIAQFMRDTKYNTQYDFWVEFEVFGATHAGQKQIAGCGNSLNTFKGTLELTTTKEQVDEKTQTLIPLACYTLMNNYSGTDIEGETVRSYEFQLDKKLENVNLYVITSNHGANAGGEEYIRRDHFVYFNGNLVKKYKPGGKSCEPFRQYNTQGNGIYGAEPRDLSGWASWNNWCPGDKVPIRKFNLGTLEAGTHTFKIEVPDAEFKDGAGYFPLSVYVQGEE